jgi:predicted esterase
MEQPKKMVKVNFSVHHGRSDKSVPYSHTMNLALELEKFSPKKFFFEIFDGGHELRYDVAFRWFDSLAGLEIKTEKELTR